MDNNRRNFFVLGSLITSFVIGGVTLYASTDGDSADDGMVVSAVTTNAHAEPLLVLEGDVALHERSEDTGESEWRERSGGDDTYDGHEEDEHEDEHEDEYEYEYEDEDEDEDGDEDDRRQSVAKGSVTHTSPPPATQASPAPASQPVVSVKTFTLATVATHNTKSSCYTAINGNVYDITSYVGLHPGGAAEIMAVCGKDGTTLFSGQHGGDPKPERALESRLVGKLAL